MRGVVFDLDGTLIDGYEGIATALNAARAAFGMPAMSVAEVRGRVGHGLPQLMIDVVGAPRAEEGVRIFRSVYDGVCEEQSRLMPAVREALSGLHARGVRLSIASNKPASYSARIVSRLGVRPLFDAIEGPDTAGSAKPDPAMIRACLAAMRVAPEDALYVGDMPLDADAGAAAGVPVALVLGGSGSREDLARTGRPVLANLAALLEPLG